LRNWLQETGRRWAARSLNRDYPRVDASSCEKGVQGGDAAEGRARHFPIGRRQFQPEALQRLEAFDVADKYRYRLSSCVAELGKLSQGKALAHAARELFPKSAYQIKGQLRMALSQMSDDRGVYTTQKAKAIAALHSVYRSLDQDIDALIRELA
jgi:hypothetical protein